MRDMAVHVAILKWPYIRLILDGQKTVESRFTKTARPPYRCVRPGETIYFKASSGPYMAKAVAGRVVSHDNLTPTKVNTLRKQYNRSIRGDDEFWRSKRTSRYATLIQIRDIERITTGPTLPPSHGLAWFVLDRAAPPKSFHVMLTAGAIRNGYLRVPKTLYEFPPSVYGGKKVSQSGRPVTLIMPDRIEVRTDICGGSMFRWRGWGGYYRDYQMSPGDAVRLVQLTPWRFRVDFVECYGGVRITDSPVSSAEGNAG